MNHEPTPQSVQAEVLATITTGSVTMRPKWHFAVKTVVLYTSTIVMSLLAVLILSFSLFVVERSGLWFAPGFGPQGWLVFIRELPWLFIILAILLLVLTQLIVRRFSFSYSRPAIYSAATLAVIVIGGGSLLAQTTLHHILLDYTTRPSSPIPVAGPLYQAYGQPTFHLMTTGVVTEVEPQGYEIENRAGEELHIIITPQTQLPFERTFIINDHIIVIGTKQNDTIFASGIRKANLREPVVPKHKKSTPKPQK
jgi:hypothetical protein